MVRISRIFVKVMGHEAGGYLFLDLGVIMSKKHENNWDNRYDEEQFFYGEKPNYFVADELPKITQGRGLFLAEGEGRNIVFAASLGHDVVAVDNSVVGKRKAMELARRAEVEIEYRVEDIISGKWDEEE